MRRSGVTIHDIAENLGVSASTVSRVLNGSALVASGQRDRILDEAKRLGYRKEPRRRQARRTIVTIALVLPEKSPGLLQFFFDAGELVDSIHAAFGPTRTNVVVVSVSRWRATFEQKKMGDVDGCILAFTDPRDGLQEHLSRYDIPVVTLNRTPERGHFVSCDNRNGMALLVEQVTRIRGCEHGIAYVDYSASPSVARERREGFLSGAREQGLPDEMTHVFEIDHLAQINDRFFRDLGERNIRSVMCFNDLVAVFVYQAALHRSIRIPEDLSITGFDNSPVRQLLDRQIDTVDLGAGNLAQAASEWLIARIIRSEDVSLRKILPARYIPGNTL